MSENKILTEEELKNVAGGKLTPEAKSWFEKHYQTILTRMCEHYAEIYDSGFKVADAVFMMKQVLTCLTTPVLDIQSAKELLKNNGIDCDDLD